MRFIIPAVLSVAALAIVLPISHNGLETALNVTKTVSAVASAEAEKIQPAPSGLAYDGSVKLLELVGEVADRAHDSLNKVAARAAKIPANLLSSPVSVAGDTTRSSDKKLFPRCGKKNPFPKAVAENAPCDPKDEHTYQPADAPFHPKAVEDNAPDKRPQPKSTRPVANTLKPGDPAPTILPHDGYYTTTMSVLQQTYSEAPVPSGAGQCQPPLCYEGSAGTVAERDVDAAAAVQDADERKQPGPWRPGDPTPTVLPSRLWSHTTMAVPRPTYMLASLPSGEGQCQPPHCHEGLPGAIADVMPTVEVDKAAKRDMDAAAAADVVLRATSTLSATAMITANPCPSGLCHEITTGLDGYATPFAAATTVKQCTAPNCYAGLPSGFQTSVKITKAETKTKRDADATFHAATPTADASKRDLDNADAADAADMADNSATSNKSDKQKCHWGKCYLTGWVTKRKTDAPRKRANDATDSANSPVWILCFYEGKFCHGRMRPIWGVRGREG
ncbi:hypothetical protein BAUCODRAFT_27783 [Baudoinia panamericana UAMH 10762]|uniref:SCP domain-containing protein n=1 Tax=Baudoinia panamericana (strain UAMH 10762) TaxID=717646 RepID=M2LEU2_BAUPA|nr:uncharacterized protein BAUCODRAFT_27783 [Baudoinia panamericana UAMH 10762]EMC92512.1 hypothetical protein BAUCODRAFT_27783 [Baudoinia panamericana UAMH 10762]